MYKPFDGDFDDNRIDELKKFAVDLVGDGFIPCLEMALSFNDGAWPEWMKKEPDPPTIRVEAATATDEGWDWDEDYPIPDGWTVEQVIDLFQYGTIYFKPAAEAGDTSNQADPAAAG